MDVGDWGRQSIILRDARPIDPDLALEQRLSAKRGAVGLQLGAGVGKDRRKDKGKGKGKGKEEGRAGERNGGQEVVYQGVVQDIDPETADVPLWKKALMKKRMNKVEEEMEQEKQRQEEDEAYKSMPAWKRNIVKKRREEQAASEAIKQQPQGDWDSKMAEIGAMPAWKKKIFLERNPQYKTD